MLDSSVWLSYILKDSNFERANGVFLKIKNASVCLIVTNLIIGEIINVLIRNNFSTSKIIKTIKKVRVAKLNSNHKTNPNIFTRGIINRLRQTNLKSMDFLILFEALVYQVDTFYTYDIKQNHAYEKICKEKP